METKKIKQLLVLALYVFLVKLIIVSMFTYTSKQEDKTKCEMQLKEQLHKPYKKNVNYEYSK
jgi:hypothetical protein